jgi:NAD(P)-dependent dehydrogenase (short-subunit alcohol dehydrogenase family)
VHYGHSKRDALATVRDIEALGRRAAAIPCDLGDERAVRGLLAKVGRGLGAVSCVVNNASQFAFDDAATFTVKRYAKLAAVNLGAPLVLAQALARQLPRGAQGVVVNLLDQKLFNPNPDFLSYTLTKAALEHATTLLAQAFAPRVRVVGVAPGITLLSGEQSSAGFERAHRQTPLRRSSTPADVAAAVVYLARARAVTGTTLLVDGGQHLVHSPRDIMFMTEKR